MRRRAAAGAALVAAVAVGVTVAAARRAPGHAPPAGAAWSVAAPVSAAGALAEAPRAGRDAPSAPGATLRLEGQVLGPDGAPVGGARVELTAVPPRAASTELDGSFALDGLAAGSYVLSARAEGLVGGPVGVRLAAGVDPVVLHLVAAAALVVDVVDERGAAVVDAAVALDDLPPASARSDAAGRARLAPLRPGEAEVTVSAPGFADARATAALAAGTPAALTVVLRAGHAVSGRVVDEGGAAVAGAQVAALDAPDGRSVTSDASGAFRLADRGAGPLVLAARDAEHAPALSAPIVVGDEDLAGVVVTMRAGGVLRGRVLDAAGRPVAAASVRVTGHDPSSESTVSRERVTDAEGRFELRGLPRRRLEARAEGEPGASEAVTVDLAARAAAEVELRLDVTGSIAGTVAGADGEAVPEVQVGAFPADDGAEVASPVQATSDGAGGFTLRGVRAGVRYQLAVSGQGPGLRQASDAVTARAGDRDVRLVLVATGGVRGRLVVRGGGAPPADASVQVDREARVPAPGGAFSVGELAPGRHEVTLQGGFTARVLADVLVEPGRVTDLGAVEVSRGRSLAGQVVDARGAAVAGAEVTLEGGDPIAAATSDARGRFTLRGVPSGAVRVVAADAARGTSTPLLVAPGDADPPAVRLVLRAGGTLAGVVTSAGRPAADVAITVTSVAGDGAPRFAHSDAQGAFVVADVPPGAVVVAATLAASPTSLAQAQARANVAAGARTQVALDLPRGSVSLVVSLPPAPTPGAEVVLLHGEVAATSVADLAAATDDGRAIAGAAPWQPTARFDALVPGDYTVCAVAAPAAVTCRAALVAPSPPSQGVDLR